MKALILGGGWLPQDLAQAAGVKAKLLLPIWDKPMVEYVIDCLRQAGISKLVLVAEPESITNDLRLKVDAVVPAGKTIVKSLENGLNYLSQEETVLISACDLPLLSVPIVQDFIELSQNRELKLAYAFSQKAESERKFPGFPHTYVHLKEGFFCGGGLFLFPPSVFLRFKQLLQEVTLLRKTPWKLVTLFGFKMIWKYFFHILSVAELEKKVSQLLGVKAGGIVSPPEVAFNIDSLKQYHCAQIYLAGKVELGEKDK